MKKIEAMNFEIFRGIAQNDLEAVLECLNARIATLKKNAIIFEMGDKVDHVGLILKGKVQILRDDYFGNRSITTEFGAGQMFAESIAGDSGGAPVTAMVSQDAEILFLNYHKVIHTCHSSCSFHEKIIENMLFVLSRKNRLLNDKIEILSKRSIRDKIMALLYAEATKSRSNCVELPFNRQQMADYLSVERSALSRELGHMQDEGIIHFERHVFKIL